MYELSLWWEKAECCALNSCVHPNPCRKGKLNEFDVMVQTHKDLEAWESQIKLSFYI